MAYCISGNDLSVPVWKEPRCLIERNKDDQMEVNEETLSMLQKIIDPVVVVGIVGIYRTGKSYLMNRLPGQPHGFELGSTVQGKTKGIWVWCVPHPTRQNCCMVLLDTEGLGDVQKGNVNYDTWIFVLTVLLSSTMVYNSIGTIAQQSLDDLHFVAGMAEHIKIKSKRSDDESSEFVQFFPSFIWAVRDFSLDLVIDGNTVTEDEYLDHALQLKPGVGQKVSEYNLPRECIRTYFPQRKCFVFPRPVEDHNMLKTLESVADLQLNPKFLQQTKAFRQYVFEYGRIKTVNGKSINGRLLGGLVSCYVDAIRNGAVPCIESAVETTAKVENERAIKKALKLYRQRFTASVTLPTETMLELSNCHHMCEREAADYFMKMAIFDSEKIFDQRMMQEVTGAYQSFVDDNEKASRQTCELLLSSLHQKIENDIKAGKYAHPGGYESYRRDMESLVQSYRQTPGKGVMLEEALRHFTKQQEAISSFILKADQKLTEESRKAEEESQKAEASERQKLAVEEKLRKQEQLLADEKKRFKVHTERLKRQAAEDLRKILQESEQVLSKKLAEQKWLLKEGFEQKATAMNIEIEDLKEQQNSSRFTFFAFLEKLFALLPDILKLPCCRS